MNGTLWDTSVLSHAAPGGRHAERYDDVLQADGTVTTAAPALFEVLSGLRMRPQIAQFRAQARWLTAEASAGRLAVLPYGRREASLAARLRAAFPLPERRPRAGRSKPDDRVAWIADIGIAACAWLDGRGVLTENATDFERIAGAFPEEPLEILLP